jgi:hypothetical protein
VDRASVRKVRTVRSNPEYITEANSKGRSEPIKRHLQHHTRSNLYLMQWMRDLVAMQALPLASSNPDCGEELPAAPALSCVPAPVPAHALPPSLQPKPAADEAEFQLMLLASAQLR